MEADIKARVRCRWNSTSKSVKTYTFVEVYGSSWNGSRWILGADVIGGSLFQISQIFSAMMYHDTEAFCRE